MITAPRLLATIQAAAPNVRDVSIGVDGVSASVKVLPETEQTNAQPAIDSFDWSDAAQAAWDNFQARGSAASRIASDKTDNLKVVRAVAAITVDEINLLREWIMAFKAAAAAATSLADLKTRVAALDNLPDRTMQQAKTAIQNRINDGTAD